MPPSLPSDILHIIFEYNLSRSPEIPGPPHANALPHIWTPCERNWRSLTDHLASVVLVARSWCETGMPLLYRHVQLASYANVFAFAASLTSGKVLQHGGYAHWVRRITYQFPCPHQDGDTVYPDPLLLTVLGQMLDACPNLRAVHHGLNFDSKIVRQLYDPASDIQKDEDVKIRAYDFGGIMQNLRPSTITSLVFENKEKFTVWEVFGAICSLCNLQSLALNLVVIKDSREKFRDRTLQLSLLKLKSFTCGFYLGVGMEQSMAFLADNLEMPSLEDLNVEVAPYGGDTWPIPYERTAVHLRRFLKQQGRSVENLRLVLDFDKSGGPDASTHLDHFLQWFPRLEHFALNHSQLVMGREAGHGPSHAPIPIYTSLLKTITSVVPDTGPCDPETDHTRARSGHGLDYTQSLYRHLLAFADGSAFPALEKICITEKSIVLHLEQYRADYYKCVEIGQAVKALLRRGVRMEVGVGVPIEMGIFDKPVFEGMYDDDQYDGHIII